MPLLEIQALLTSIKTATDLAQLREKSLWRVSDPTVSEYSQVAARTTAVLDGNVDPETKQVTVKMDGRQRPIVLAVPDAIITGAVIERVVREA